MNIWSLDKHDSIKHLLLLLVQDMGTDTITVVEAENLNHKAVRVGTRNTVATAYLYTYAQSKERYGLHLEYPYHEESNTSELEEIYEDLPYDNLLEILKMHFQWHAHQTG